MTTQGSNPGKSAAVDVARLEVLREAATAGPWQVDDDGDELAVTARSARGLPGSFWSTDRIFRNDVGEWSGETEEDSEQRKADAALIVAAVNALPDLCAAVRERDALVRDLTALAEELGEAGALPDTHGEFDRGVAAHQRDLANRLRALLPAAPTTTEGAPQ